MAMSPPFSTSSSSASGKMSPSYPTAALSLPFPMSPPYPSSAGSLGAPMSPPYPSDTKSFLGGIDGSQFEVGTHPADRFILDSLTQLEIAPDAVGTSELTDGAVTAPKLDRAYQPALSTIAFEASEFRNITGVGATTPVEVNDEDAASSPDGVTTGIRVAFEVPDNYNGVGNVEVFLRLSPSTSLAGDFRIEVDHRRNGGALVGAGQTTVTPSATADAQTLVGPVLTLAPAGIAAGDSLALRVSRLGADGADSHTGAMRLFSVIVKVAV